MSVAPQMIAGGDINPCRFVRASAAANQTILEADAGSVTIGISQMGTRDAPQSGSSALAAASGQNCQFSVIGQIAPLEIGSGGCTANDKLKSDADGQGVTTTTNNDWFGAIALETAVEGEKALCLIMGGYVGA